MKNTLAFLSIFILISSCQRSFLPDSYYYTCSDSAKCTYIIFKPDNKFEYCYNGIKIDIVTGKYTKQGNKLLLTSDYLDKKCYMEITESFDSTIKGSKFLLDSDYRYNYIISSLVINDIPYSSYGNDKSEPFAIKNDTIEKVTTLHFTFGHGYYTDKYAVKGKANVFNMKLYMPKVILHYFEFENKPAIIKKDAIIIDGMRFTNKR